MIRLHEVSLAYRPDDTVLHAVSLHCPPGSITALTGPSGAGKSSILRLIAGLIEPVRGELEVAGLRWHRLEPEQAASLRRRMGLVFQEDTLLYDRDVYDNVALPLIIGRFPHSSAGARVRAALAHVGLEAFAGAMPGELSGGQRQRITLARAVVAQPQVLLVDEPTAQLDAELAEQIMDLLKRFQRAGVTVLLATHDQSLHRRHRLPCIELHGGRVRASSTVDASRGATRTPTCHSARAMALDV